MAKCMCEMNREGNECATSEPINNLEQANHHIMLECLSFLDGLNRLTANSLKKLTSLLDLTLKLHEDKEKKDQEVSTSPYGPWIFFIAMIFQCRHLMYMAEKKSFESIEATNSNRG